MELICEVKSNTTVWDTVWMKGNETITENSRVKFIEHKLFINKTMESDAGYYTCSVRTRFGIHNKTAFIKVTASDEEEDGKFGNQ